MKIKTGFARFIVLAICAIVGISSLSLPSAYAASAQVLYIGPDASVILIKDDAGDYYVNGNKISQQGNMRWERVFENSWSTGYFKRSQTINYFNGSSSLIAAVDGTYTSPYTGTVQKALFLQVKKVHMINSEMSYSQSGQNPGKWEIKRTDVLGLETPRDTEDFDPVTYLVINADTGAVVDFYSSLNPYYYSKAEVPEVSVNNKSETIAVPKEAPQVSLTALSDTSATLSWGAVPHAFMYEIENNGQSFHVLTRTASFVNLTPASTYQLRIRGANHLGAGPWQDVAFQTEPSTSQPLAPESTETQDIQLQHTTLLQPSDFIVQQLETITEAALSIVN
ncbi:fibronectin type III domain-containing protein [Paenibacillus apiarius]|uniref:fibronectin type III domain-containing protein n=1 Tax=Paenibacillus apiarius TaxID=46240 RepID=UPI003B3A8E4E